MTAMTRIRSGRRIPSFLWVPPVYNPIYKLEIIRSDSTVDDITDSTFNAEIIDGVTESIGNFEIEIDNSDESRTGIWTGNEIFNFYCDYALTATTKRFRGRIEKVSYKDFKIKVTGRAESMKLLSVTVTKSYDNIETSVILKNLFDTYATNFTYSNVNVSTTNASFNWYQKPFWTCIQELCHSAGFDAYIDPSLDCHYFKTGTVDNPTEAIVHDSNLIEVGDFAKDYSLVKNRIIVYGAEVEGLPLIKTAESLDANFGINSSLGIKELILTDKSIVTGAQCQQRADFELSLAQDPPIIGDVSCSGLATIQPGERIQISVPYSNLPPQYYKIVTYKHEIIGAIKTTVTIEKEPRKVYHVLKDNISVNQKLAETPNPNEMRFSIVDGFDADSGTHSSTEITEGRLKTDGAGNGTWISDLTTTSAPVTSVELRVNGESLPGTLYFVSTDSGSSWQQFSSLDAAQSTSPPGTGLKIKITILSASTQINSYGLLYKS